MRKSKGQKIYDAYWKKLNVLTIAVINDIYNELRRINRTLTQEDDSDDIEFFTFKPTVENDITEIRADGTIIAKGEETSMRRLINDDIISISDAISLYGDLVSIKK